MTKRISCTLFNLYYEQICKKALNKVKQRMNLNTQRVKVLYMQTTYVFSDSTVETNGTINIHKFRLQLNVNIQIFDQRQKP